MDFSCGDFGDKKLAPVAISERSPACGGKVSGSKPWTNLVASTSMCNPSNVAEADQREAGWTVGPVSSAKDWGGAEHHHNRHASARNLWKGVGFAPLSEAHSRKFEVCTTTSSDVSDGKILWEKFYEVGKINACNLNEIWETMNLYGTQKWLIEKRTVFKG